MSKINCEHNKTILTLQDGILRETNFNVKEFEKHGDYKIESANFILYDLDKRKIEPYTRFLLSGLGIDSTYKKILFTLILVIINLILLGYVAFSGGNNKEIIDGLNKMNVKISNLKTNNKVRLPAEGKDKKPLQIEEIKKQIEQKTKKIEEKAPKIYNETQRNYNKKIVNPINTVMKSQLIQKENTIQQKNFEISELTKILNEKEQSGNDKYSMYRELEKEFLEKKKDILYKEIVYEYREEQEKKCKILIAKQEKKCKNDIEKAKIFILNAKSRKNDK